MHPAQQTTTGPGGEKPLKLFEVKKLIPAIKAPEDGEVIANVLAKMEDPSELAFIVKSTNITGFRKCLNMHLLRGKVDPKKEREIEKNLRMACKAVCEDTRCARVQTLAEQSRKDFSNADGKTLLKGLIRYVKAERELDFTLVDDRDNNAKTTKEAARKELSAGFLGMSKKEERRGTVLAEMNTALNALKCAEDKKLAASALKILFGMLSTTSFKSLDQLTLEQLKGEVRQMIEKLQTPARPISYTPPTIPAKSQDWMKLVCNSPEYVDKSEKHPMGTMWTEVHDIGVSIEELANVNPEKAEEFLKVLQTEDIGLILKELSRKDVVPHPLHCALYLFREDKISYATMASLSNLWSASKAYSKYQVEAVQFDGSAGPLKEYLLNQAFNGSEEHYKSFQAAMAKEDFLQNTFLKITLPANPGLWPSWLERVALLEQTTSFRIFTPTFLTSNPNECVMYVPSFAAMQALADAEFGENAVKNVAELSTSSWKRVAGQILANERPVSLFVPGMDKIKPHDIPGKFHHATIHDANHFWIASCLTVKERLFVHELQQVIEKIIATRSNLTPEDKQMLVEFAALLIDMYHTLFDFYKNRTDHSRNQLLVAELFNKATEARLYKDLLHSVWDKFKRESTSLDPKQKAELDYLFSSSLREYQIIRKQEVFFRNII